MSSEELFAAIFGTGRGPMKASPTSAALTPNEKKTVTVRFTLCRNRDGGDFSVTAADSLGTTLGQGAGKTPPQALDAAWRDVQQRLRGSLKLQP